MDVEQLVWRDDAWATPAALRGSQLVFVFGSRAWLERSAEWFPSLAAAYPDAVFAGCSTAGEIVGERVVDDQLVTTAARFDHAEVKLVHVSVANPKESYQAGRVLAEALLGPELAHVFVLSDGLHVNGDDLVRGISGALPEGVTVTGGLSGDAGLFERTLVIADGSCRERVVTAVALYGSRLRIGYGSLGGWDPFGPERLVTRSEGNVLYELDGRSALELYKSYLGSHAAGLPGSGLLFPLCVRRGDDAAPVVRTILGVDEEAQSMTFAGDVPTGSYARLMRANLNRLLDGAAGAAQSSQQALSAPASLAILISCVGRKMVLKQRVEEEVEAVREVIGDTPTITGFYSYGEISPFSRGATCELHNQTMTITTFAEV